MVGFNKFPYNLHAVIIIDGDYECTYVRNRDHWYFFEDGHSEIKKTIDFDVASWASATYFMIYTSANLISNYSYQIESNLLDVDERKPYTDLVRKELQNYAATFNLRIEQEFNQLRQE